MTSNDRNGEVTSGKPKDRKVEKAVNVTRTAEPQPSETRRLPHADAHPAPVFPLLKARWPWLATAAVLGAVLGLLLGSAVTYQATASLRIVGESDSFRMKQIGQSYEQVIVTSSPVMQEAAQKLGVEPGDLAGRTKAVWSLDTDIVQVSVTNKDGNKAIDEANKVVEAVVAYVQKSNVEHAEKIRTDINAQLNKPLANGRAESARQDQMGSQAADSQAGTIQQGNSLVVADQASVAEPSGAPRTVTLLMGALGGLLLGAVLALAAGAGRRRVRSPAELRALAPELRLRSTTQAGEVAGRLLESGHSSLVVLSLPSTPSSASRFAAAVANHLRTHGSSVTLVNAISLETSDSSAMTLPDEVWVLRRDIRQDVKAYFSTDLLVVACTAEPEAIGLISGQSDLMAVVVAKEGRSTVQQIWDTVSAVESAEPLVVVAP